MTTTQQLSVHIDQVFFGGNWTSVNLDQALADVSREMAVTKYKSLNTIADLTFHIFYYVKAITNVLEGNTLNAHDMFSYDTPEIKHESHWLELKSDGFACARRLVKLAGAVEDTILNQPFEQEKYGSYHRNLLGLIEHTHYHLGQISLIKKLNQAEA